MHTQYLLTLYTHLVGPLRIDRVRFAIVIARSFMYNNGKKET